MLRLQREEADRAAAAAISLLAELMCPAAAPMNATSNPTAAEPMVRETSASESAPAAMLQAALERIAVALPRAARPNSAAQAPPETASPGTVLVNPHGFAVTISPLEIALAEGSSSRSEHLASAQSVVVPALGYALASAAVNNAPAGKLRQAGRERQHARRRANARYNQPQERRHSFDP